MMDRVLGIRGFNYPPGSASDLTSLASSFAFLLPRVTDAFLHDTGHNNGKATLLLTSCSNHNFHSALFLLLPIIGDVGVVCSKSATLNLPASNSHRHTTRESRSSSVVSPRAAQ